MGEIARGGFLVGFFEKSINPKAATQTLAPAQIAITGLGPLGHNAQSDQRPGTRQGFGLADTAMQGCRVGNMVVGGKDQHQGLCLVRRAPRQQQRRCRQGRGGVARGRLQQQGNVVAPHPARILAHLGAMARTGDNQRRGVLGSIRAVIIAAHHALQSLLQQGQIAGQCVKLLGRSAGRQGPKARAATTGQHHRGYFFLGAAHCWRTSWTANLLRPAPWVHD